MNCRQACWYLSVLSLGPEEKWDVAARHRGTEAVDSPHLHCTTSGDQYGCRSPISISGNHFQCPCHCGLANKPNSHTSAKEYSLPPWEVLTEVTPRHLWWYFTRRTYIIYTAIFWVRTISSFLCTSITALIEQQMEWLPTHLSKRDKLSFIQSWNLRSERLGH